MRKHDLCFCVKCTNHAMHFLFYYSHTLTSYIHPYAPSHSSALLITLILALHHTHPRSPSHSFSLSITLILALHHTHPHSPSHSFSLSITLILALHHTHPRSPSHSALLTSLFFFSPSLCLSLPPLYTRLLHFY
jgi:hypothetical protein